MTMRNFFAGVVVVYCAILFSGCDKGYEIRCSNFYTEPMDTVKIGGKIVFSNVPMFGYSDFVDVKRGEYAITFISQSKKTFHSSVLSRVRGKENAPCR